MRGWVTPRYARQLGDEGQKAAKQGDQLGSGGKVTGAERDSLAAAGAALHASLWRLEQTGR